MEEKEVPINDVGDVQDLSPKQEFWTKPKKLLVVLICALIVLAIYIIVILGRIKEDKKNEKNQIPDDLPDIKMEILGRIYCNFVLEFDENVYIANKNFIFPGNFSIYVDGNKIQNSKKYNLKKGENNVTFVIYEDFNMSHMFYDISNLVSVKMVSEKKCKITHMDSTFEKCKDLIDFSIE